LQQRAGNESVVGYLHSNYESLAEFAVGSRNRTPEEIRESFEQLLGEEPTDLQSAVSGLVGRVASLERELAEARRSAERARTDLANANEELESVRREYEDSFARQRATVDQAFDNASSYSAELDELKSDFELERRRLNRDAESMRQQLQRRINELLDEVSRLEQTVAELGREGTQPFGQYEAALVDGRIVGTNLADDEVFISLGGDDKVFPGLTFQVYNAGSRIVPNEAGEFPPGKATIEVIRRGRETSTARILNETAGDAVIAGDAIVNAVYDPEKEYEFVVFGNFDTDGDFVATPQERDDIRAIIEEWGGTVTEDLSGTTDYVVLGTPPVLPPEPRFDDPPAIVQRYAEARERLLKYEDLLEKAVATRIPVLNQNRLYTLTGLEFRR
jgi:outer membrane murein-binding lipoprotein Lpp